MLLILSAHLLMYLSGRMSKISADSLDTMLVSEFTGESISVLKLHTNMRTMSGLNRSHGSMFCPVMYIFTTFKMAKAHIMQARIAAMSITAERSSLSTRSLIASRVSHVVNTCIID